MINGIRREPASRRAPEYYRNTASAQTDMPGFQNRLTDNAIHSVSSLNSRQEEKEHCERLADILNQIRYSEKTSGTGARSSNVFNGLDILGPSAPDKVRNAWVKAEAESGVNGYGMDSEGKLTQITALFAMSVESMVSGKGQDILGNSVVSAKSTVQKALDRLGIPRNDKEKKEKLFYEAFLRLL